ncbi:Spore wall maturation protein DIT1 [Colletotrichum trifolii]|uniref:Spore wall maturation protein DIT1 n=1 Tax=Colletotrichum trifolii TaxID=5466 RepID=A0A4V3HSS0_COLTR|nr:Spore wall maturation protein DIT1 [Colletotrichum trifolii]
MAVVEPVQEGALEGAELFPSAALNIRSSSMVSLSIRRSTADMFLSGKRFTQQHPNLSPLEVMKPGPTSMPTWPVDHYLLDANAMASQMKNVAETSGQILDIVFEYALNKFHDTMERLTAGAPRFTKIISKFVKMNRQVEMCLPAFPFKSANKVYKVLGDLPDKAEELALERLNRMCERIRQIYPPGAKLTVISDGLVYNDLLCIPDRAVWAYGQALRAMSAEKGFTHIAFSRLKDLMDYPMPDPLDEIRYIANATNFRRHLLNAYGDDNLDIDHEIATNPDTLMTYCGYCRFLESDLRHIFPTGENLTRNGYKRDVKFLAKQMLIRGYAFAGAVKATFPHHLRLSIHQSTGEHKISMSLLDTKTGFTTPWHCSVALMADGEWTSAPMGDFKNDSRLVVIEQDGRPSYFQET